MTKRTGGRRIWVVGVAVLTGACAGGSRVLDTGPEGAGDPEGVRLLETVGFQERADWPSVLLHIDADEIGGRTHLLNLLRRSDRVELRPPEDTEWGLFLVDADGRNRCPVAVYVNGSRYGRAQRIGNNLTLDRLISPDAIAGLELHEGTEGPVLPGLECGALLIWSPEADPVYGFLGDVTAVVAGAGADRVDAVVLEPGAVQGRKEGDVTFFSVPPGEYEVHFRSGDRVLDVRQVRVYAFAETEVQLEVN